MASTMTYADFLRGRKSTEALAREWDAKHNGGRRVGPAAPAAPPAGASAPVPPAPAPAPAPPPVSVGRQAGIDSITDRLAAQPGLFNPRRLALYAEGGRGLTDRGYFDKATVDVAAQGADGSTSYRLVTGPDGQLYREAINDTAAAANSRGMLFSSATREQQATRARDLTNARDSILRSLSSGQDDLTRQQAADTTSLRGDLPTAQGDYADWRSSQPVPVPPAPTAPAGPTGPAGSNPRAPGWATRKIPGFRGFSTNVPRRIR